MIDRQIHMGGRMPLTYNELAENLREEYPGKYSLDEWTNERLAKRFLTVDPALKD